LSGERSEQIAFWSDGCPPKVSLNRGRPEEADADFSRRERPHVVAVRIEHEGGIVARWVTCRRVAKPGRTVIGPAGLQGGRVEGVDLGAASGREGGMLPRTKWSGRRHVSLARAGFASYGDTLRARAVGLRQAEGLDTVVRSPIVEVADMRNGDVALRLSIVLSVVGFIALAAALYEIDRREKSSSATGDRHLVETEQRIETLSYQIHVLSAQLTATERQIQALGGQLQALTDQYNLRLTTSERQIQFFISRYDARLKELEDDLRVRRLESAPVPR
jgi:hypothetical protein